MTWKLIHIEPTTRCNLRCRQCRLRAPWWTGEDIPFAAFNAVMEWAKTLPKPPCCILQGHGEPLMHPDYVRMFEIAADVCREGIEFQTNGTLLTPDISHHFIGVAGDRWKRVKFSIDGHVPEVFNRQRPGADFGAVVANMDWLARRRHPAPAMTVECVVTALNIDAIKEMPRFARDYGADVLQLSPLSPWEGVEDITIAPEAFAHAVDAARAAGVQGIKIEAPGAPGAPLCPPAACAIPNEVLFVAVDGSVLPCCMQRLNPVGNLQSDGIGAILNGARRQAFIAGMENNSVCGGCPIRRPTI